MPRILPLRLDRALRLSLLIGTCLGSSVGISWAGPEGGVVSQGNATINQNGGNTTINQSSNRALIDWQSFNVGQNESVNFIQNGTSSIAINRIHDANPSSILGSLSANGQIMLINPNGVVFGSGAKVDVGSLVVSTASPTDRDASDFISGARNDLNLSVAGNPNAKIINNGIISAKSAGLVGFVAPNVINNGVIVANKGTVLLASGSTATLDMYGDGLVNVAVSKDVENQLIAQHGWVQADGGKVVITAAAGEHIVNSVINMDGVTQAHSIEQKNGEIILKGDKSTINVSGKIDVSGKSASQKGGKLTITGKHINLKASSVIDASGDKGGGSIKIGGDYKGQGDLYHAQTLTMEKLATIYNDAISSGNGGSTILWSDNHTYFAGDIFARGGAAGGNGGFVETSGKKDLTVSGHLDLSAMHGASGTWLLDPTNITIFNRSVGGTDNVNTVTTSYLEGQNANIILTADNNLTLDMTGDTLNLTGTNSITLNATTGSILTASAGTIKTNSGNISLNAGSGINLGHAIALTSTSGNINLNNNLTLGAAQSFNTGTGAINFGGTVNGSYNLTAAGGAITFNGAWGGTTGLGTLTLTSTASMSLPSITTAAGKAVNATVTVAGGMLTSSTIIAGTGGNITLKADDLTINGDLTGTGNLILTTNDLNRTVFINTGSDPGTAQYISQAEIDHILTGWTNVTMGGSRYAFAGNSTSTTTFKTPIYFGMLTVYLGGSVTSPGNIGFGGIQFLTNGSFNLNSTGGNITVSPTIIAGNGGIYTYSFTTAGGNINVNAITNNGGDGAYNNFVFNAGAGTLSIGGTVNGKYHYALTAGAMTFNGAWGGTTALGNVSLTSASGISLPAMNMTAGNNFSATVTGAGNAITASAITMNGGGALTLTADDLTLNGNLSGTGELTLQPYTNSRIVRVNGGAGDFNLDTTDLSRLVNGWNVVNIGRQAGAGNLFIGSSVLNNSVTFRGDSSARAAILTGSTVEIANYNLLYFDIGYVDLYGNVVGNGGNLNFNTGLSNGLVAHGGSIQSLGNQIYIQSIDTNNNNLSITNQNGNISVFHGITESTGSAGKTVTLSAANGTVLINDAVNTAANLTINANAFNNNGAAWGGTTALGNVTLTSVSGITLPSITTAAGKTFSATVTGAGNKITTSAIATGTGGTITLTADDLAIGGALSGTGTLTLQPYTNLTRTINVNNGLDNGSSLHLTTAELNLLSDGWNQINIGKALGGDINLGTSSWIDPVNFRTSGDNKVAVIAGNTVTGTNASLAFNTGWVDLYGNLVTTNAQNINLATIGAYGLVTYGGNITSNGGNVTIQQIKANNGNMTINSGNGNITVINDIDQISASAAGKTLTFNAGTGTVSFGSIVNTAANITASGSALTLNGAWGGNIPLGDITLTSNSSITLPAITIAAGKTFTATVTGAGNTITASSIATGTGGNINLTADDLILNGDLSGTGGLTLNPYSNIRLIRVNFYGGDFNIDPTEISHFVNGWGLITIGNAAHDSGIRVADTTWVDPVKFITRNDVVFYGINKGNDNASIATQSIATDLNGTLITNTGAITLTGVNVHNNAVINSTSGNVTLGIDRIYVDGPTDILKINSGSGNITLNGNMYVPGGTGSPAGKNISFETTGAVAINGTINGAYNLSITGSSITTNGAWGATNALGDVTLNAVNNIILPAITTVAGKTVSATVTGAGNSITASAINTGTGGNISLIADDVILTGDLSGTGSLVLKPYNTGRLTCVNGYTGGCVGGNAFHLDTTEIAHLADGWTGISIGRSDGEMIIGTSNWSDPITFNGAIIGTAGNITGTQNASFKFLASNWLDLRHDITTANNAIEATKIVGYGGNINTGGGNFTLAEWYYLSGTTINSWGITTNGGNISIGSNIANAISQTGKTMTLDAGAGTITFGNNVDTNANITAIANSMVFNGAWGSNTALGDVSLTSVNALSLPSITAASIFARTTGATSDITIGSGKTLTSSAAGTGITLVAKRNFINQAGSTALVSNNGGRWLVYSTNPTDTTGEDTLASNFKRYSCTYGGSCPTLGTGNGLLYAYTPFLTVTPSGISVVYGNAATLTGYGYNLSGYLGTDGSADAVTGSLTATSDYTVGDDVGHYALNYDSGTLASAMGYGFTYADNPTGLNVTARTISVALTGTVTKIYDGNDSATLAVGNYTLGNIYNSDNVTLGNATSGTYNNQNAGTGKNVSVSGLTLSGSKAGNYVLATNTVSGNVGTITPKGLTVTATAGQSKVYGTANGVLGYSYTGLVGGDTSASFTGALARVAGENAGTYAINQGTLAATGNYAVSSFVGNNFTISKAALTVTATAGQNKNYGTADNPFAYSYTGLVNGDSSVSFTGALGRAAGNNAGSYAINQGSLAATGNYEISGFVSSNFTINKIALTITANDITKLGNTAYSFTGLEFTENGLIAGDHVNGVSLNSAGAPTNAPAGSYSIAASNATGTGLSNYNITYVNGTLTVNGNGPVTPPPVATSPVPQQVIAAQTSQPVPVLFADSPATMLTNDNTEVIIVDENGLEPQADIKAKDDARTSNCLYSIINFNDIPTSYGSCS